MADLGALLGGLGVGGTIGQAIVRLELDTKKYTAEMEAAQAQTVGATNSMGAATSRFGGIAKAAFLGLGVAAAAGVAASISAASDLNEQINKTKVVFGSAADEVLAFSETTAKSLGVSETAALTAAGSFGQILDAAGLTTDATSKMSISLVKLSADLASFNNIDPTEALDKLQSGLAGQARPLREVGVFLSAARVEAEAYGSGIAKVGEELTDAQKIQARYNIIMDDTAKAQGDFARTVGDSLPNQLRVLRASLEDVAAQVGQSLIPAMQGLVGAVTALLPLLEKLGTAMQFLPLVQMGEDVDSTANRFVRFGDAIIDTIPILGHFVDLAGDDTEEALGQGSKGLDHFRGRMFQLQKGIEATGDATKGTKLEFKELDLTLDTVANTAVVTRSAFVNAFETMERRAHQLANAMQDIAKEDWVNPQFVAFLSQQGPEWLIQFSKLTVEQQRVAQQAWRDSTRELDNAKDSQDKILEGLNQLDGGTSKHTVIIDYRYEGFDPTKPGMSTSAQQR